MPKITFIGAGSTVFAKNVLGDCLLSPLLNDSHIALYDIDQERLLDSEVMLNNINQNSNENRAQIVAYTNRKDALRDADYVINAIQVGGYEPCTVTDFDIPKTYGLRQTIGDTLGIGGIFRGLRTIPVMLDIAEDMASVCPKAWLLNYTNPMSILTLAMLKATDINTIGLCHSVQVCVPKLFEDLKINDENVQWKIAGINHMAWLLEVTKNGIDLYPEIKKQALLKETPHDDMVRYELMKHFGYYITESSEHNAEYTPYFIKNKYPELIQQFNIPLDEYPRRCIKQIAKWKKQRDELIHNQKLIHTRSNEYGSHIIEAMESNIPYKINGNVMNRHLITNLPSDSVVEVPCLVDRCGITPCHIGALPVQLAALNRTNINVHQLTVEAALTHKKEYIYQAALLDPHTSSELSIDEIIHMCDDLITAHGDWLPSYH